MTVEELLSELVELVKELPLSVLTRIFMYS